MIGRLRGMLLEKKAPHLLLDVSGVGYEIDAPMSTFYNLPEPGNEIILHTHLVVREDSHTLFGFFSESERSMFRSLIKISGVGAKLALTILSGISVDGFITCVEHHDAATLIRLPGVGKKTAERLIIEMKDRIKTLEGASSTDTGRIHPVSGGKVNSVEDAVSALIALGYKPQDASRMVRGIDHDPDLPSQEIIRLALQGAVKHD
ncbi:MAG: Holliday junction branch migration protein RuvA [Gammaproteobacteria bacterium]|nr:Holliday junction branch migration protein RuvA [Gammaproteobacteria bacterium]